MDFFEQQEVARRRTGLLIFCFVVAVLLIILAVYCVVAVIFFGFGKYTVAKSGAQPLVSSLWNPEIFVAVAGVTLLIIAGGSVYKIAALSAGGSTVAELLGGRRVQPDTTDLNERVLLNVVEEMSIASGVPVPEVYVLENEPGINAFAAGFSTGDAVVAVTRGALELLTRDELQGVIGHEFSHILNGDMRLNLRL